MSSVNTFNILFWLHPSRRTTKGSPLFVRITVNGKRSTISLKQFIEKELWDKNKQKLKGRNSYSKRVNEFLDNTRIELIEIYQDLRRNKKMISADLIKAIFTGEAVNHKTLQEIVDYHNTTAKNKLSIPTQKHYRTSQRYLFEFLKEQYKLDNIYLKDLDYQFITGFESFLRTYSPIPPNPTMSNNTVMKHIQRVRKMIKMAYHMEWITKDPFIKFQPRLEKTHREFLTEAEVEKLKNYTPSLERLEIVRDLYLFSCYTGIAFIDIMHLSPENIVTGMDGQDWISFIRTKTKERVKVPVLPPTRALIIKYQENPRCEYQGGLLPRISNEKTNAYLKEIATLCNIKKRLTFHMARHTFATTITLSNGVPIETVSKLLGHRKIATTQIYAKVLDKKISEDMNNLKTKLFGEEKKDNQETS